MDKTKLLLEALRQAAGQPEARLYRSGKVAGLFASRTGPPAEVAAQALADGLLEVVRSETKGKTVTDWVKLTAKGEAFLVENESPLKALEDLHAVLKQNQEGLPVWLGELRGRLDDFGANLVEEVQAMSRTLQTLTQRVVDALERAERMGPALPAGAAGVLPWSNDAVAYLNQRQRSGLGESCPLPELFAVVRKKEAGLTIRDFHSGLRRLHDRGVLRLLTYDGSDGPPEPEYALLDGPTMYYYAAK
jgi:hypothetical protein